MLSPRQQFAASSVTVRVSHSQPFAMVPAQRSSFREGVSKLSETKLDGGGLYQLAFSAGPHCSRRTLPRRGGASLEQVCFGELILPDKTLSPGSPVAIQIIHHFSGALRSSDRAQPRGACKVDVPSRNLRKGARAPHCDEDASKASIPGPCAGRHDRSQHFANFPRDTPSPGLIPTDSERIAIVRSFFSSDGSRKGGGLVPPRLLCLPARP